MPRLQLKESLEAHRVISVISSPTFLFQAISLLIIPYPSTYQNTFDMEVWTKDNVLVTMTYSVADILLVLMFCRF